MSRSTRPASALRELQRRLFALREQRNLSMGTLEARTGLSHGTVSAAFNGTRPPSERTLYALARALRTEVDPLLSLRARALDECETGPTASVAISTSGVSRARTLLLYAIQQIEESQPDRAIQSAERAIAIMEPIAARDPHQLPALATAQRVLATALHEAKAFEAARDVAADAALVYEDLNTSDAPELELERLEILQLIARLTLEIGDDLDLADRLINSILDGVSSYRSESGHDERTASIFLIAAASHHRLLIMTGREGEAEDLRARIIRLGIDLTDVP